MEGQNILSEYRAADGRIERRIPGRRVCGSDFQGIGEPFKRNCPSRSAASHRDLNVSAGDPHRVALDCLPSGRPPASPVLMSNFAPCHGQVSLAERTDLLLAAANATRSAAAAVDIVFTAAGATTNYRRSLLQRALRDIHAVTRISGRRPCSMSPPGGCCWGCRRSIPRSSPECR